MSLTLPTLSIRTTGSVPAQRRLDGAADLDRRLCAGQILGAAGAGAIDPDLLLGDVAGPSGSPPPEATNPSTSSERRIVRHTQGRTRPSIPLHPR